LNDLFERLHNAYEDSDEKLALVLKQEIDTLKESIYKREQRRMKKKEEKAAQKKEKEKVKKEKKEKPQSANATPSSDGKASTTQSKTDKPKKQIPNITGREDGFSSVRVEGEPDTKEQIRAKLDSRIKLDLKKLINPPRPGKACLVLDIDYTLFDHRWHTQVKEEWKKDKGQVIPEFQRPYLHQFLATCYEMVRCANTSTSFSFLLA
jgi:ubiquitin-like domain-containing CTD phosphatase 1